MDFFENKFFLLAITFGFFFLSKLLQKKTGWVLLNPILVAIAMLICFLQFTGVSYETYSEAGSLVEFWLKPAVVALGVPLYLQLRMIKKQLMPILISQLAGCVRRAELAGLTWSDFDFKECTVHVNKSLLVFRDFGYQHTATKESNDRYIDAAPEYMAFMQQYKKRRESIRNQLSRELYGK
jgi:signal transduction histidine kinase